MSKRFCYLKKRLKSNRIAIITHSKITKAMYLAIPLSEKEAPSIFIAMAIEP